MKRFIWLLFVPLLALGAERAGPYVGLGYGIALYDDDGRFAGSDDDTADAYRLYAGAYTGDFFSVEAEYTLFGTYSGRLHDDRSADEEFSTLTVNLLFHTGAMQGRLDWFAKIGAGEVKWEESFADGSVQSDSGGTLVYGGGAGYRLHEDLTLRLEYDRYDFELKDSYGEYQMTLDSVLLMLEAQF